MLSIDSKILSARDAGCAHACFLMRGGEEPFNSKLVEEQRQHMLQQSLFRIFQGIQVLKWPWARQSHCQDKYSIAIDLDCTCKKHAPANNGEEEDTGLGDELESPVQVEQTVDILRKHSTGLASG